jgi:hypothetical protein
VFYLVSRFKPPPSLSPKKIALGPFTASVGNGPFCGAVLLPSRNAVLTTGSCVTGRDQGSFITAVGACGLRARQRQIRPDLHYPHSCAMFSHPQ